MTSLPPPERRLSDPRVMSFGEHLEELRRRLIVALLGVVPVFVLSLVFGEQIMEFLIAPLQAQLRAADLPPGLQATGLLEVMWAYLRVAIVITVLLGFPWIIWQLWLFIAPGLYENEKRFARILMPLSAAMTALGIVFLYYVMMPAMILFLIRFGAHVGEPVIATAPPPPGIVFPQLPALDADPEEPAPYTTWFNRSLGHLRYAVPLPDGKVEVRGVPLVRPAGIAQNYRISEYIGLVFIMGLSFALGFQMPVVVLLLGWVGIVDRKFLARNRKYALFLCVIAAAVLTPSPDPFSMVILAVPLYLLYELGMVLLVLLPAGRVARGFRWGGKVYGITKEPPDAGDA
jgi:sec-independent protein translocase protein TatC